MVSLPRALITALASAAVAAAAFSPAPRSFSYVAGHLNGSPRATARGRDRERCGEEAWQDLGVATGRAPSAATELLPRLFMRSTKT
jgi:ethanolamine utilization microcompartment shell protein EutL